MSTTTTNSTTHINATALRNLSSHSTLDECDRIEAATRRHNPAASEQEITDIVNAAINHRFGVEDDIEVIVGGRHHDRCRKHGDLYNARLQAEDLARVGIASTIWVNNQPYLSHEVDEATGRVEIEAFAD